MGRDGVAKGREVTPGDTPASSVLPGHGDSPDVEPAGERGVGLEAEDAAEFGQFRVVERYEHHRILHERGLVWTLRGRVASVTQ